MKSIDKLRTAARNMAKGSNLENHDECNLLLITADEIETEISEVRETTRKKHQAERVYWNNELHKILDAINGQERFWGACMDYPLSEATVPPSEVAKRMLSERYMRLPVDADGEPIRVRDKLTCGEVFAIADDGTIFTEDHFNDGRYRVEAFDGDDCHHVKPRTLEDVLRDVWKEALDYAKSDMWRNPDEVFAERADEIRELLGGDAE